MRGDLSRGTTHPGAEGRSALLAGRNRRGAACAGGMLLAGSVRERFAVFRAGFASADEPRYTIVPQRQPVEERNNARF